MTVLAARENLIKWFLVNETFDSSEDFDNLLEKVSLTRDLDKAAYEAALNELASNGFIVKADVKGTPCWILVKPLHMQTRMVEINFQLAKAITDTINNFSRQIGGQEVISDSCIVGPNEIVALLTIIEQLTELAPKQT